MTRSKHPVNPVPVPTRIFILETCRRELKSYLTCYTGTTAPSPTMGIPNTEEQQQKEETALRLFGDLELLNQSRKCKESIKRLLCLQVFGLCDDNDVLHTTDAETCADIGDNVCADESMISLQILGPGGLSVCENLDTSTRECKGIDLWKY